MATQQRMDPRLTATDDSLSGTTQESQVRDLLKQLAGDGSLFRFLLTREK